MKSKSTLLMLVSHQPRYQPHVLIFWQQVRLHKVRDEDDCRQGLQAIVEPGRLMPRSRKLPSTKAKTGPRVRQPERQQLHLTVDWLLECWCWFSWYSIFVLCILLYVGVTICKDQQMTCTHSSLTTTDLIV